MLVPLCTAPKGFVARAGYVPASVQDTFNVSLRWHDLVSCVVSNREFLVKSGSENLKPIRDGYKQGRLGRQE